MFEISIRKQEARLAIDLLRNLVEPIIKPLFDHFWQKSWSGSHVFCMKHGESVKREKLCETVA